MKKKLTREDLLAGLKERLESENKALEQAGLPQYVRLSKTRYFSSMKKEISCYRRMAAIRLAIEVLEKPFREIDVLQAVIDSVPVTNTDLRASLEEKAVSIYLNERKEACRAIFETHLPVFKKQMTDYLLSGN